MSRRVVACAFGAALLSLGVGCKNFRAVGDGDNPFALRLEWNPGGFLATANGPGHDLGLVTYPADAIGITPTSYAWTAATESSAESYQVEYALAPDMRQAIMNQVDGVARGWGCVQTGAGIQCNNVPPQCTARLDGCILDTEAGSSAAALVDLGARFVALQQQMNLDARQIAEVVVAFVQHIQYDVPQNTFQINSPAVSVADNRGDCDSKSLLGYVLLRAVGVQSMIFESEAHVHAMLGIAVPGSGEGWTYDGVTWLATEMTAENFVIGFMDPSMREPNDWAAMPLADVGPAGYGKPKK